MKRTVGGVTITATPTRPDETFIMVTGTLSLAGKAELAKRVRAGENEQHVLGELLIREGKAVGGKPR